MDQSGFIRGFRYQAAVSPTTSLPPVSTSSATSMLCSSRHRAVNTNFNPSLFIRGFCRKAATVSTHFPSFSRLSPIENALVDRLPVYSGIDLLQMRRDGYVFIDKTKYIHHLEGAPRRSHDFILLCRPRRFGKSLTLDMLKAFHGIAYAETLQETFKVFSSMYILAVSMLIFKQGTYVADDEIQKFVPPSRWFTMKFNFLSVTGHDETAVQRFYREVLGRLQDFRTIHQKWLQGPELRDVGEDAEITPRYLDAAFRKTFGLVNKYLIQNGRDTANGVLIHPDSLQCLLANISGRCISLLMNTTMR